MGIFKNAFNSIAKGIEDLSSLEVVSYKGTILIKAGDAYPETFDKIMENASVQADFKIIACTTSELDGDVKLFYDQDITQSDMDAHLKLVEAAHKSRQGVIEMFKNAIANDISVPVK